MTLDKNAIRRMLEEYFSDFGPDHRFELDLNSRCFDVVAQEAKRRIPHPKQVKFDGD